MKKTLITALSIFVLFSVALSAHAATIAELKAQLAETQAQLSSLNSRVSGLAGEKAEVDSEIAELDASLMELMSSISLLEDEIEEKKGEIEEAKEELEAAIEKEHEQYEAMKTRIRFMYEKRNVTYAQLLFESKSIADMLNKADYIEKLYEYDRRLLADYQEIRKKVEELKQKLEDEKSELEAQEYELEEEKAELQVVLDEKKKESKNFDVQIAQSRQSAAQYKALISKQNAQIKQLEAEEAARKAAQSKTTTSKSSGVAPEQALKLIASANGSAKGKEIASYACKFIGNPYVAGGTSLTNGADCSGFTQAVYRDFGISIPRNSAAQRAYGKEVTYDQAQPGDLVCYSGHVGMYIGNGYIVHASTERTGIRLSVATYRPILSIRRIL